MNVEAERILPLINGAAKALDAKYQAVRLSGQFRNDQGLHAVVLGGTVSGRSKVRAGRVLINGIPAEPPPSPARAWQALAATNINVADALRLLGAVAPLDWVALYKLAEIVKDDVGKTRILSEGWATEEQLSAFGAAANRPDVSGDLARHARVAGGAPKVTMTLDEGSRFVGDLLRTWLEWRAANP
ncbi:MAG: hypothetical protein LC808_15700 [Actinobacteria bacterium]|nr:hypothetical protein [Actinomycetota bacterium]